MANVIKLRKGLDINLKGKAAANVALDVAKVDEFALVPEAFVGVTPKVVVREGDHVNAGDALFVNKACPEVKFASPVSGEVTAIVRGERRKVLCVKVKADAEQKSTDFGKKNVDAMDGNAIKQALLEAGLFGYINQLPYAVSTTPDTMPKAIFVSALRARPRHTQESSSHYHILFVGLTALSKMAKTYLGVGADQQSNALTEVKGVEVNVFDGPCPAGNVGVQVNNIDPVNKLQG